MYKLRFIGDPVLRRETELVNTFGEETKKVVDNMVKTMHREDGIGLAAPQVGISKKILVVDISPFEEGAGPRAFINPEIVESWGEAVVEEGCLSIPDVREDVSRPEGIKIVFVDENGSKHEESHDGWMARVLQHEIDHLNGVLFIDLISPIKRQLLKSENRVPESY